MRKRKGKKKVLKSRESERRRPSGHDVLAGDGRTRDIRPPVQANGTVPTYTGSQKVYSRN